jgi:hypothetical protein
MTPAMRLRPVAAVGMAALAFATAGCGGGDKKDASAPPAPQQQKTESGASTLRATLTALLSDHVYQAGVAITTGLSAGLESDAFKAAAGTLDKNSVALSKAIESVYGAKAGNAFLGLWRSHITMLVDYTRAKAGGKAQGAAQAKRGLDGYRQAFGAFIAGANPNLPKAAVAAGLKPHVQTMIATIDAAVAQSPTVFEKLAAAAHRMSMTARILAGGIAQQFQDKFSGAVDDGAAELRSSLTSLLEDHVYLAGVAIATGVNAGLESAAFKAASATLDTNSVALSKAIGSVYGAAAGKAFLGLWRSHIGMFVDYTKAKATKDAAAAENALGRLDKYRADFGAFMEGANPNLSKEAVANELEPHVTTVAATIRAVVARSPKTYDRLAEAAAHMPHTASMLATGIVKQFPAKFPAA